jgi:hypothetical protein
MHHQSTALTVTVTVTVTVTDCLLKHELQKSLEAPRGFRCVNYCPYLPYKEPHIPPLVSLPRYPRVTRVR